MIDLVRLPHLLIGGKDPNEVSTAIRSMLASIVFANAPSSVRLVLLDSDARMMEAFARLPHLRTPVVHAPASGVQWLEWAVGEMRRRYGLLSASGVRTMAQYSQRVGPLPAIVVVVNELAELMRASSGTVEQALVELAQMARGAAIHLIVGTSDLSVRVVSGQIKSSLLTRMAFKCGNRADSRTLVDRSGAEQLLGEGDCLFLSPTSTRAVRLHAPCTSVAEGTAVSEYLARHGEGGGPGQTARV
jgi:S-DNA-T family DNA segregation ATPase FtsK/SpoIIIE